MKDLIISEKRVKLSEEGEVEGRKQDLNQGTSVRHSVSRPVIHR